MPWQEPDPQWGTRIEGTGRFHLHAAIDGEGRRTEARSDIDAAYGDWDSVREQAVRIAGRTGPVSARLDGEVAAALRAAESDPANLTNAQALALMASDDPELAALVALADAIRRDVVGDAVTYVVNRNINFTNVCYTG
nr:hypothetical protein [Sporichthya polymorpha]